MDKGSNPASRTGGTEALTSENHSEKTPHDGVTPEHPSTDLTQARHVPGVGDAIQFKLPGGDWRWAHVREAKADAFLVNVGDGVKDERWFHVESEGSAGRWPEGQPEAKCEHGGMPGVCLQCHPLKPKRKAPKEGLCKRRGCKEPVADVVSRLCIDHMPNGMGVAPEDPQGPQVADLPAVNRRVVVTNPAGGGWAARVTSALDRVVILRREDVGQDEALRVGDLASGWSWRYCEDEGAGALPVSEAGVADTEPHTVDLTVTHGKNGVPELEAVPETKLTDPLAVHGLAVGMEVEIAAAIGGDGSCLWARTKVARFDPLGFYVTREGFQDFRFAFRDKDALWRKVGEIPQEHEQPNDGATGIILPDGRPCPAVRADLGGRWGSDFEPSPPEAPPVRTCIGVPGAVGDDRCHTVLGADVVGDRCSRCRYLTERQETEQAHAYAAEQEELCGRAGCGRPHDVGSRYCPQHRKLSEAAGRAMLREAMDAAWEAIRDIGDPDTYDLCRRLRDAEVGHA